MTAHHCPPGDYCYHPLKSHMRVLELVARGMSRKHIAVRLGLAESTVKNAVSHMNRELECNDAVTLVLKAAKRGLIDLDAIVAEVN